MKRFILFLILSVFSIFSMSENTTFKIIELSWTSPDYHQEFIQKNLSLSGSFSVDLTRNLIIIDDIQERVDFIESHIRKTDISKGKKLNLREKHPIHIEFSVEGYERFTCEVEIFSGEEYIIDKKHPLIYSENSGEKENYNVVMLGPEIKIWFEKLSLQKVFAKMDVEYTYLMGWTNGRIPVIEKKTKTLSSEFFVGDTKEFRKIILGDRIVECKLKIGYNMLSNN